jgi:rhodanese-related sulfurtransferase
VNVAEVPVQELKRRLDAGEPLLLLDVREPWECTIARLPGSVNIPLNEIPRRLQELGVAGDIVVMCKSGGRSRRAAEYLLAQGFERVGNLSGGINAWTREIDPGLTSY